MADQQIQDRRPLQVSDQIRHADVDLLRQRLEPSLQSLDLTDEQVRRISQMDENRQLAKQNARIQAPKFGVAVEAAEQALDLQWRQFIFSQPRCVCCWQER
jgi:hypothetical protein